jgi:hypothetical protein
MVTPVKWKYNSFQGFRRDSGKFESEIIASGGLAIMKTRRAADPRPSALSPFRFCTVFHEMSK